MNKGRTDGTERPEVETWILRLRDRPGALERVLSLLRRRRVGLEGLSFAKAGEDRLDVELHVGVTVVQRERIQVELAGLADVEAAEGEEPVGLRRLDSFNENEGTNDGT